MSSESGDDDEGELEGQVSDREEYDENDADLLEDKPEVASEDAEKDELSLLDSETATANQLNAEPTSGKTKQIEDLVPELSNDGGAEDRL